MKKVFYIDPQSSNNLAMYDYELLSRIGNCNLFFFGNRDYNFKQLNNCNCHLIFNYNRHRKNIFKGMSYLKSLLILFIYTIRYRPDIIHIQWLRIPSFDYYYYKALKKIFHLKIVYTVHNILPHIIKPGTKEIYNIIYKELADTLIVHTVTSKSELVNNFKIDKNKVIVAPHGPLEYNFSKKEIEDEISKIKNEYHIKESNSIVSLLGYQSYYKGSDILINAWQNSKELSVSDSVLIIAGKFQDVEIPKPKIKNLICIPRKLSDIEFASLLRMSDLLVFPYRRIEQSGLLLSAIQEGIPYCSTNVGELLYPLTISKIGWEINDNSPSGLEEILLKILNNKAELKNIKENMKSWERIRSLYDWNYTAKVTENCYLASNNP